jgi:UV DNA damage repair endonuclease
MTVKKIGFACKWIDHPSQVNGIKATDDCKKYNTGGTTVAWLNRQHKDIAVEKLWNLMKDNINSVKLLVEKVGGLDENLRMVRLSSDILPLYTEPNWSWFWRGTDVREYCERAFRTIGDYARKNSVRLSMHPGQFTVLASDNIDIVQRSIEEFEYHADMARWMGYGQKFQDFKINVHISGRKGPIGIREVYPLLSSEARNCITIENEEISYGVIDCLELADIIPIVLDIHHNWVREGTYLRVDDDSVNRILDSWRGVRPTMHYSVSREDCLIDHPTDSKPCLDTLIKSGYKKQKLRAHSDFMWNSAVNEWALSFNEKFDIMVEAKAKNLASFELARFLNKSRII